MIATRCTDMLIAAGYGVWLFLVGFGSVWRDARQQIAGSM